MNSSPNTELTSMRVYISSIVYLTIVLDTVVLSSSSQSYIESLCSKKVAVKTAIEIQIDYHWVRSECTVTLVPYNEGAWLRAFFVYYSNRRPSSRCSHGAIYLYNSQYNSLLGDKGYCYSHTPKGYHTLGTNGSIHVTKRSYSTNLKVRIRIVEYFLKNETCPDDTFDCGPNDQCVAKSLECESHRDCPSGLDEGDHCPKVANYSAALWLALVVVITVGCCLCVPLIVSSKSKPNNVWAKRGAGRFDGAYASNFGTAQPVVVMGQAPPYGNPTPGNMAPNYSPNVGWSQPVNVGPQNSYTGFQGSQTAYTLAQGPQTTFTGVQQGFPPPSPNSVYIPQGYVIQQPAYPPPPYPYGGGSTYPQPGFGS